MPAGPPTAGGGPPPPPPPSESPAPAVGDELEPRPLTDEEHNRRVVATTAAIALIAVAMMIGTFLATRDDGESVPPEAEAAADPSTSPGASATDVDQVVADIEAFVESERELPFLEDVQVEILDQEAYAERAREQFDADIEEDRARLDSAAGFYQAIQLWPAGTDPVETLSHLFTAATLGFYDSEDDELVVRGGNVTPLLRATLAHELTHALDDQHFDLDRPELEDRSDEAAFAFSALVEGDATRVEEAYRATLSPDEQVAADAEESQIGADADISEVPPIALVEQQFLYTSGGAFVSAVYEAEGNAGVDAAFDDPPVSSEQIMEPEHWLAGGEPATEVEVPEADGDAVDDSVAGQFVFDLLTDLMVGGEPVPEWEGDHYVLWQDGTRYCMRLALVGEVQDYQADLEPWATGAGATLEMEGDRLLVTACN
jgi:hypothetical protein